MDTATISDSIINQALKFGFDFDKMHGKGYDRCRTMTGKGNSVQRLASEENFQKKHMCTVRHID